MGMEVARFISNKNHKVEPAPHPWREYRFYNSPAHQLEAGEGLPTFRFDFDLPEGTARVTLRATALGLFNLFLNGVRVGDEELKPGWTDYHCRVFQFDYDVTELAAAHNTLVAPVSVGWWSGFVSFGEYGWNPVAFACEIRCEDAAGGTLALFGSDTGWKTTIGGQILTADLWKGEYRDATRPDIAKEPDAYEWEDAVLYEGKTPAVVPHVGEPVRVREALSRKPETAVLWRETSDNGTEFGAISPIFTRKGEGCEKTLVAAGEKLILDMGQEMVGAPSFLIKAARGTRIEVYVAEMLNDSGAASRGNDGPAGSLYMANYRTAIARTVYVASGEGEEHCRPTHAFFGFRYCQIFADGDFELLEFKGAFISTDMRETGFIETSNKEVNRLFQNILWGQRCNYLSVPTDCPQRDERLGWTGDTQIFAATATYNADARGFLRKWLGDARDAQRLSAGYWDVIPAISDMSKTKAYMDGNAAWGDAGVIVPYVLYLKYNDVQTVAEHYDSMEKYMDFLATFGMHGPRERWGDWLSYEETPQPLISLAYYGYDALLMQRYSKILNKPEREAFYADLYGRIKAEFARLFVADGALTVDTQTAYLLALRFGMVEGEVRERCVSALDRKIRENGFMLSTGFVGTGVMNQTLSEVGLDGLAYSILLQTEDPSWIYSIRQGATTVWERWNSYTKANGFGRVNMNSFNHYAYGAVGEWMYSAMAGIAPDEEAPGFHHFILSPRPDTRKGADLPEGQENITFVRAYYDSAAGRIESAWDITDGVFTYRFTIPAGSRARVEFPLLNGRESVVLDGREMTAAELGGSVALGKAVFELGGGTYVLQ